MSITGHLRSSVGAIVRMKLRRQLARFKASAMDCRQTQARVLKSLLDLNRGSRFATDHNLTSVQDVTGLRRCLPVAKYELFQPYIDALRKGDSSALLGSENRLMMFTLSSGTTAESKFIPVTQHFYEDYRRGWQTWGIAAYDDHPALRRLRMMQIVSDYDRFRSECNIPCGNISGLAAFMQKRIVRSMYTLPYAITRVPTPEAKYYTALRLAIADPEVGMVTTANPSTLVHLARMADERSEELIKDIFDGGLSERVEIPAGVRESMRRRLGQRNPGRARQLERLRNEHGRLLPQHFWSHLQLLAVWTGGSCAAYLPTLREYFGMTPVRDHGLSASEGRMTLPLEDETCDGVLDVSSHFFEFIPEEQYGQADPVVLEAHELQRDHNYYILLTTASGLYRYDICDVVRCVDFLGTTPVLRFLHKGAHISNITGEKLAESQVVDAVRSVLGRMNHRVEFFTLVPVWGNPPCYHLLLEEHETPREGRLLEMERLLDERLCETNCEYHEKRATGRLAEPRVASMRNGSWTEFARMRQSRLGGSIEQYKHPCLIPGLDAAAAIRQQFVMS